MPDAITQEQLPEYLESIRREFEELRFEPALGRIRDDLRGQYRDQFAAQSGPNGEAWEPWHFRHPMAPDDHPTLQVSGRLAGSLQGGADGVEEIGERSLVHGTRVPYAGIHQDGATFRTGVWLIARDGWYLPPGSRITIPARPFVGISEETLDAACEHVADHIVDSLTH